MFVPDDEGENSEEVAGGVHDLEIRTGTNQDDYLPPLMRLERYAMSDNLYNRQMVGRVALETLRAVADTPEDVRAAMDIINRAAADTEITVGADLMEQLPHIAMICHEERDKLHFVVEEYLLPLVIRFLGDSDNQVRKTTQASLLVLMEQGLVELQDVEQQICPVILKLTEVDNLVEYHTGAVALMSKMAPLLGAEATERLFMHRFASLCSDPVFYVRKVCANNFGEFCSVVGTTATEEFLLPYFVELCTDGIWGVRKACAEVFTTVSVHCTLQTRKDTLAPVFNNLLLDQSRWVRMSAFQALGQFIATFIKSGARNVQMLQHGDFVHQNNTRLHMHSPNEGMHILRNSSTEEAASILCNQSYNFSKGTLPIIRDSNLSGIPSVACYICLMQTGRISPMENISPITLMNAQYCTGTSKHMSKTGVNDFSDNRLNSVHCCEKSSVESSRLDFSCRTDVNKCVETENSCQNFNTFQYWRVPIPELVLSDSVSEDFTPIVLSRRESNDNRRSCRLSIAQFDDNATINHELDSLASRLEQGFLIDNKKERSADAHTTEVSKYTNERVVENLKSSNTDLKAARIHHTGDNLRYPDSSCLGMLDEGVQIPNETNCAFGKNSISTEQVISNNEHLSLHQVSHVVVEEYNPAYSQEKTVIAHMEEKSSILFDAKNESTSSVSPEKSLLFVSDSTDVLYSEQRPSSYPEQRPSSYPEQRPSSYPEQRPSSYPEQRPSSYPEQRPSSYLEQRPSSYPEQRSTYQEQKHYLSFSEGQPITSYHEEESDTAYSMISRLIQSDVPSNRPIQDIVPHYLVDHFVSMTHPLQAQTTDNEITHHCAFSIPAVALTLGRANWHLIKPAYEALASDVQWKVRRTVAASIHELAVILGEELAGADLVPVFHGFIKDLDEVRIGALRHLADFLRLLRPAKRSTLLHRFSEFHRTDNECNWRFRSELAEQLLHSLLLFPPGDTHEHITPLSISLLMDKVAAVRKKALSLVTQLVHHVSTEVSLVRNLLAELAEQFAHNKHWNRRQTFALLCSELMTKHVLKDEHFASDVFPHLLDLSWDSVPNVRLSVAHTLACDIAVQSYFSRSESPHTEVLIQCLKRLQGDDDKDVQYFASLYMIPPHQCISSSPMVEKQMN